jgi:hypothetical protein
MQIRVLRSVIFLCATAAAIAAGPASLTAQTPRPTGAAAVATRPAKTYTAPRTPWGDPDLQGNYTNVYESGTPFERPDQFAGRKLDEVKGEELATLKRQIQQRTIERFQTPFDAPDHWWQDALFLDKGSQAWLVTDPQDGKIPPITDEGQRRIDAARMTRTSSGRGPADSYEDRSLYDRCITRGFPVSMLPTIYGNSYRIVQGQGYVGIMYEMIHETRIIPLEAQSRPHVGKSLHLDMGDARGHWEGDTLVVETTNFNGRSAYRNADAETLRLTERFTRIAPDKVKWSVTVDDPSTWTRPWTFALPLTMTETEPILPYECHEGNYGLRNILSAARAEEEKK